MQWVLVSYHWPSGEHGAGELLHLPLRAHGISSSVDASSISHFLEALVFILAIVSPLTPMMVVPESH
jgi:hypothetical protein